MTSEFDLWDGSPAAGGGGCSSSVPQSPLGTDSVHLKVSVLPAVNYTLWQNGAAVVSSVTIENLTDIDIRDAELRISASPEFISSFRQPIDLIPAGKTITLSALKVQVDATYLASLTEKVTSIIQTDLAVGDQILHCESTQITVYAFNEWHGLGMYPEMLSSFVTPNHPELAKIISRATVHLGQWTGDTAMDGYQSQDPNRVLNQAAAIFTALSELDIAYCVPPASFENAGQRVRLCDTVLQQKLGTCLDLTLLYAACLEAVGLHPLLITQPGHIFAGVWLEDRIFPECVQDDYSLITKRLAEGVNEIAVVETTCITNSASRSFDDARKAAEKKLTDGQLEYIIDVQCSRKNQILPLPQRISTASGWKVHPDPAFQKYTTQAPQQLDTRVYVQQVETMPPQPKKVQWERKLLDLGMRNTLINLRMTKTQLPILTNSLDALENALADGSDFTILPKPADLYLDPFSFDTLAQMGTMGIVEAEFQNKRLRSVLTETELTKVIKELYRSAKTALEENGANTLYLALGMLRWYESQRSTKPRYAPIILVPIEMVRKSAAQGYVIRLRDDEPQMNITLLEKLKQDFGIEIRGLDPLPMDDHGIDIRRVLTVMRQAVMEQPQWDVLEATNIGIFSFSQFVMWNDIRNRTDDLVRNKVVHSLMEGKLCWDAQPLQIGDRVSENNILLPMPADASQLYAIETACRGESFVLHGPPGTGKSQTITSLIANALAQGKSVLFVAEKMAALEVVQKRLDSIGIGPFCLELHSNKSKKRDVLEQLRKATEVTKTRTAEEYEAKAQQLAALRSELDTYATELHQVRNCGATLYTLISRYEQFKDAPDLAPFDRSFIQGLTAPELDRQAMAVERLVAAGEQAGHPAGHPFSAVGCTQYTQTLRSSLESVVQDYLNQCHKIEPYALRLSNACTHTQIQNFEQLQHLAQVVQNLNVWYKMPTAWTAVTFPQQYFAEVEQLSRHSLTAKQLEDQLLSGFDKEFLSLDGRQLLMDWKETSAKWFLPKMLGTNKLVKKVNAYAKTPVNKDNLQSHLTMLRDYQQEMAAAKELLAKYGADLGDLYQGEQTDWEQVRSLAAEAGTSAQNLYSLQGNYDSIRTLSPGFREVVDTFCKIYPQFTKAKTAFDELLGILPVQSERWISRQTELCQQLLSRSGELKEWIAYAGAAAEAEQLGLSNVVNHYKQGAAHQTIFAAYKKAVLKGLICHAIDDSENLNSFSGAVFNKKIDQYKRMDQQWAELSRQEVYCRLAAKVPNFTQEAANSSELGILQRCIKSGGRGTSIRRLFDQIPNLLPRLCPCMLMSPISAAQYLDPKREPFDLVVFDEASQLPTCKAVGVLARGKDAVIVGDPKQMPPTAFFATNTVDEDNLEAEDLESILDDCLALNMPQSYLLWHYRSRHESLIAFSNSRFYENKLFTFPSVNDRESKVRLVPVNGVFERGKNRVNREEAQAVVDEIIRRSQDPVLSGQSLGVVTFNISQQHLIDDLLTDACTRDPELEKWAFGSEEPLFIKNLENVQGDERDVILFSIGFGPDENGKVYMNFGPLNRDGGWRRLNVAVSRARCEMMVFSTLRSEQLDLNRTKAEGVAALKAFLEYAEGRALALDSAEIRQKEPDGIALSICEALKEAGYDADLSVGRSEYRIHIGVVDPADPQQYLLGIMLDGDGYSTAKTTRDREIAQAGVLNGLGWNIHRVWSMDWWDNREKELSRILSLLQDLRNGVKPVTETPAEPLKTRAPARPKAVKEGVAPTYQAAALPATVLTADEFVAPGNRRDIQKRIRTVVDKEAPLSLSVLTKRVVQSYGITRAGARIQSHFQLILDAENLTTTTQDGMVFYWKKGQDPQNYCLYRVSGEGDHRRDVRDVPMQEVANAVCMVLQQQISMAQEDLLRETAKKLGYTRLGGNVLAALELGIQYALSNGIITTGTNGAFILTDTGTQHAEAITKAFTK